MNPRKQGTFNNPLSTEGLTREQIFANIDAGIIMDLRAPKDKPGVYRDVTGILRRIPTKGVSEPSGKAVAKPVEVEAPKLGRTEE